MMSYGLVCVVGGSVRSQNWLGGVAKVPAWVSLILSDCGCGRKVSLRVSLRVSCGCSWQRSIAELVGRCC